MEKQIPFDEAEELVPEGIELLIGYRRERDDVPYEYAKCWIEHHFEFYTDSQNRVWVITDFPEEPGCWVPELHMWVEESEMADDDISEEDEEG